MSVEPVAETTAIRLSAQRISCSGPSGALANCGRRSIGTLRTAMTQPMFFILGKKDVALILTSFNDVRYIHLADKHSPNVKISWYGESIGHYEGDSLVASTRSE
jgi:hypothetical protein